MYIKPKCKFCLQVSPPHSQVWLVVKTIFLATGRGYCNDFVYHTLLEACTIQQQIIIIESFVVTYIVMREFLIMLPGSETSIKPFKKTHRD